MFDEDMAADLFELSASDKYCIQNNGGIGLNNNNFFLLFLNFSFYNIVSNESQNDFYFQIRVLKSLLIH